MAVFALMDEWMAAAGRTDPWLALGLELMDSWQTGDSATGQQHLADLLGALKALRPAAPDAPDPVALAIWFHHAGPDRGAGPAGLQSSAAAAYEALNSLGQPDLAREVARLVRLLGGRRPDPADAAGTLMSSVHRAAMSASHLASVRRDPADQ